MNEGRQSPVSAAASALAIAAAACWLVAAVAAAFLASCAGTPLPGSGFAPDGGGPVMFGMVYGMDGSPVGGAEFLVDGEPAAFSDSGGRFCLPAVAPGPRRLEARRRGFETYSGAFERRDATEVLYVKLVSAAWLVDEAERAASILDWPRALSAVRRALAVEPDDAVAAYLLGVCALRAPGAAGEAGRAAGLLEAAAARGERGSALGLLLAELRRIRPDSPRPASGALAEGAADYVAPP